LSGTLNIYVDLCCVITTFCQMFCEGIQRVVSFVTYAIAESIYTVSQKKRVC